METLLICRSADALDGRLTKTGQVQSTRLAGLLAALVVGRAVRILAAVDPESRDTAALIAKGLGVPHVTPNPQLSAGPGYLTGFDASTAYRILLAESSDAHVAIIVTGAMAANMLRFVACANSGVPVPHERIRSGEAWAVHLRQGRAERIHYDVVLAEADAP